MSKCKFENPFSKEMDEEVARLRKALAAPNSAVSGADVLQLVESLVRCRDIIDDIGARAVKMGDLLTEASAVLASINTPEARGVLRGLAKFAIDGLEEIAEKEEELEKLEEPASDVLH